MNQWYIAKTKANKEGAVAATLARWNVETFYPKMLAPGRKGTRLEPLFPGYLFCRADRSSPLWPRIRWAPGVTYFLGTDSPSPIPDDLVAHLREKVQDWNHAQNNYSFAPGEAVTVTTGPFAGMDAIFEQYLPARERCQVMLNTVSGYITVEMPRSSVRSTTRIQRSLA